MELDMYGSKVADAAQLIRDLTGGKEWFHEFDRNTQHTLELFIAAMDKVKADILASLPSTAVQAPVREVPKGWKLVPQQVTDEMLEAWKHELCIPVGSAPEVRARRAYKAMLAAAPLPAAPVQEPKP